MRYTIFSTLSFLAVASFSYSGNTTNIHQHLAIGNYQEAEATARKNLRESGSSNEALLTLVHVLAKSQKTREALKEWEALNKNTVDLSLSYEALEEICWAIIREAAQSSSPVNNYLALTAAIGTSHTRASSLVLHFLSHPNPRIQALSIRMAGYLGDESLRVALLRLLSRETHPEILSEIIWSLAVLKEERLLPHLKRFFKSNTPLRLQVAASSAYAEIAPQVSEAHIQKMIASKRSSVRILACYILRDPQYQSSSGLILPLLDDPIPEVQLEALVNLANTEEPLSRDFEKKLLSLSKSKVPQTQIAALYTQGRFGDDNAIDKLSELVLSKNILLKDKEKALSALMHIGPQATSQLRHVLKSSDQELFKLNAAYTILIWQSKDSEALQEISNFLQNEPSQISETSPFDCDRLQIFQETRFRHHPFINNYPLLVDYLTRLKLLSLLSINEDQEAISSLESFLDKPLWGVPAQASLILVEEIPDEARALIENQLKSPDLKVRVQAALILSQITHDQAAVTVLEDTYNQLPSEMKPYIIEAIGSIGDKSSIPFLVNLLKSPKLSIRTMSAGALLKTLNN